MRVSSVFWSFAVLVPFVVAPLAFAGPVLHANSGLVSISLAGQLVVGIIGILAVYVGLSERSR